MAEIGEAMKIGLIGAGRMGRPILDRLVAAGYDASVLVRGVKAREAAIADGLSWRETVGELVDDADLVVVIVLDDAQVRDVCLGSGGALAAMKPGAVLVQHTTSDPATAQLLEAEGAIRGVRVLDAALSGGPHDIAAAALTLWIGGDEAVMEDVRPVLKSYASPIIHVGPCGNGQRVKLVNNALFVAQVGLAIEAVRVAASLGIQEHAILSALQNGSGASRALSIVANGGSVSAIPGRLGPLMLKDVTMVREMAQRVGLDLGAIGTVLSSEVVEDRILRAP
jgi:3-hydroxyisobutyrate dehydrogenase-like beta-hydroxyacid dehydrogenase